MSEKLPQELIDQSTQAEREAVLKAAWCVARLGRLRAPEQEVLAAIRRELGVPEPVAESVVAEVQAQPARIKTAVPEREPARRLMFHCVVRVAGADGVIADRERSIAERIGGMLGLSPTAVAAELDVFRVVPARPTKRRRRKVEQPAVETDDIGSLLSRLRPEDDKLTWFSAPPVGLQPLIIVVTNLVPVFGVFFFDWEVFTILFLFWLENVIVGVFNVLKMRLVPPVPGAGSKSPAAEIPFFIVHYGMFMAGHGLFVFVLFLKPESFADFVAAFTGRWITLVVAFVSLIVEHGYAYYYDFLQSGEYKKPSSLPQFMKPYGRLAVMHVTILFGGIGVQELGSPRPALLLLIALKTLFDLGAWVVRLPERGVLGRIKAAFIRAAIAAVVAVWCGVMCFGVPSLLIGKATAAVSRWIAGRQIGGEHWSFYGFSAGAVVVVIVPAAVWWHHILSGSSRYREATKLTKTIAVGAILALLIGAAAWPAIAGYRVVRAEIKASRAKARPTPQPATTPARNPQPQPPGPPPKSQPGTVNLIASARVSSSSDYESDRGNKAFVAAKASDGERSTRWNSRDGDALGTWLAAQWEEPVTIHQIVVREAFDRVTDFTLQRFDADKQDWVDLLHVFTNRHLSSYSRNGEVPWGYWPTAVEVDGRQLENQKDRTFGASHLGNVHPIFTLNLPDPLTTTGIRLVVKGTNARTVSVFEIEAY